MIIVAGIYITAPLHAQIIYTKSDSLVYEKYIHNFSEYKDMPIGELIVETALFFKNSPYVASTLDKENEEKLTVNLREFDCTTLVETCIALSKAIKSGNTSFENYCNILKQIRYRNGVIEDYASRLHYVSDWIIENERYNVLKDITKDLGGKEMHKHINFMSTHPSLYKQLLGNAKITDKIKKSELQLNKRDRSYVIGKALVCTIIKTVKNGDIVAFSTSIPGLDFSHIGIVYINKEHVTFIHASSSAKKVIIERKSLAEYCTNSKKCNGIAVLRLN